MSKLYYSIPLLYLFLLIGILYLKYESSRESLFLVSGPLSVSGYRDNSVYRDVVLSVNGVQFFLSDISFVDLPYNEKEALEKGLEEKQTSAGQGVKDKISEVIEITSIKHIEEGFQFAFLGTDLVFETKVRNDEEKEITEIVCSFIGSSPHFDKIIPFSSNNASELIDLASIPFYHFDNNPDNMFLITFSDIHMVASKKYALSFSNNVNSFSIKYLDDMDPYEYWFFNNNRPVGENEYSLIVSDYIDKAFYGWHSSRYQGQGIWSGPEGTGFNEIALTALTSKALGDEDPGMIRRMRNAVDRHNTSYLSAPYFGDIISTDQERREVEENLIKDIEHYLESKDPALFTIPDLLKVLLFIDEAIDENLVMTEMNAFINSLSSDTHYSHEVLVGMANLLADDLEKDILIIENSTALLEIVRKQVSSIIFPVDEGILLFTDKNIADIYLTIHFGEALIGIGKITGDKQLINIGRTLTTTALSFATEEGLLPVNIIYSGLLPGDYYSGIYPLSNKTISDEKITPEMLIPSIGTFSFYPGISIFSIQEKHDIRIWSAAENISVEKEGNNTVFGFDYKPGESHRIIIRGVQPFSMLQLYGIRWNQFRNFQDYTRGGWFYDDDINTLYIKLEHRRTREQIVLIYDD